MKRVDRLENHPSTERSSRAIYLWYVQESWRLVCYFCHVLLAVSSFLRLERKRCSLLDKLSQTGLS